MSEDTAPPADTIVAGIPDAAIAAMVDALDNFPANAAPPDNEATTLLILAGFLERREITKACSSCGAARHDYSYMRITEGGKLFHAAARAAQWASPLSPKDGEG